MDSGLKYQLEKELRNYDERRYDVLRSASEKVREQFGACGNCASLSHSTKDCPRSKKVMKKINLKSKSKVSSTLPRKSVPKPPHRAKPIPGDATFQNPPNPRKTKGGAAEPRVLCIAEKPSIAKSLAFHMSFGKSRERSRRETPMCKIHEFFAYFPPAKTKCSVVCTSVLGHLFGTDFDDRDNSTVNPETLYRARTNKIVEELSAKVSLPEHLIETADGCDYLYLWLDCDNEGENICFEVINLLQGAGIFLDETRIFRAHFSALTEKALRYSFANPIKPRKSVSDSVDARQELDLKIGVSFTRLLTWEFKDGAQLTFKMPKLKVLSYGPCQTPTLNFCVQRHQERERFVSREYWELFLRSVSFTNKNILLEELIWNEKNGRSFSKKDAMAVKRLYEQSSNMQCRVVKINKKKIVSKSPEGLNTVALLRTASLALGISPKKCMDVAEKLYIAGYITYPRTESTKYPKSMEYLKIVDKFRGSNITFISSVLPEDNSNISLPRSGIDRGDHPPICPTTKIMRVGQHGWNLYEFIVRNFLASLLPPFVYNEITVTVDVLEETLKKQQRGKKRSRRMPKTSFSFVYHTIVSSGWSNLLPWRVKAMRLNTNVKNCKSLQTNDVGHVNQIVSESNWTKPPEYLKEYELIDAMDKFGIGTDASIPTHVETIVNRGYVKICDKENNIVKGTTKLPRKDASSSSKKIFVEKTRITAMLQIKEKVVHLQTLPPVIWYQLRWALLSFLHLKLLIKTLYCLL